MNRTFTQTLKDFRNRDSEDGFTLIELMIVVVIIGILAAIAIPIFMNQQTEAINATVKSDVRNTATEVASTLPQNPTVTDINSLGAHVLESDTNTTTTLSGSWTDYVVRGVNSTTKFCYQFNSATGKSGECDYPTDGETPGGENPGGENPPLPEGAGEVEAIARSLSILATTCFADKWNTDPDNYGNLWTSGSCNFEATEGLAAYTGQDYSDGYLTWEWHNESGTEGLTDSEQGKPYTIDPWTMCFAGKLYDADPLQNAFVYCNGVRVVAAG